ncbi:hypothetical protein [Bosea sp. 124]|uniref:hypothetical protein n=1 Tax=Bosea sp. 124 TaxID=2135642 RepID=UPI0011B28332|nr:hypothetical protein [Bosea sp. 124]
MNRRFVHFNPSYRMFGPASGLPLSANDASDHPHSIIGGPNLMHILFAIVHKIDTTMRYGRACSRDETDSGTALIHLKLRHLFKAS